MIRKSEKHKGKRQAILCSALAAVLTLGLAGCANGTSSDGQAGSKDRGSGQKETAATEYDLSFTDRDKDSSYDASTATKITLANTSASIQGAGAQAEGSTVSITNEGTYLVEGNLSDGQLIVDTTSDIKVQVVLDGVSIHCETGPAFYVKNADKVFLTLADNSTNALSDGTGTRQTDDDGDDLNATLLSKDDLTINGSGSLTVKGEYYHAIKSSDDLVVTGGTFDVTSKEDAFHGKDCVKIAEGVFTVNAGDDAFHSDLLTYFAGGEVDVQTCNEGYEGQAVIIDGGTHNIVAADDALNAALADSSSTNAQIPPSMPQNSNDMTPPDMATNNSSTENDSSQSSDRSFQRGMKGNRSTQNQNETESDTTERTFNDEMPSGRNMTGKAPDLNGETPSDFDLRGDRSSIPSEASNGETDMTFGDRDVRSTNGGNRSGMPGTSSECYIQINGGELNIIGGADAIDSNGNVEINGGTVVACGPSNGMDGAIDFDLKATINGGTVLLVGSISSTNGLDTSTQEYTIEQIRGSEGNTVQLLAADGSVLVETIAPTAFQQVLGSSSQAGFTINVK